MWIVWRECDACKFKGMEHTRDQLIAIFAGALFDWSCVWGFTSRDSIQMFIDIYRFSFFLYTISFFLCCLHILFWRLHPFNEVVFSQ